MSYKAFALKYRPQDFDQVIGQDQVVIPLKNAITNKRVHHAYLFSGPRGVGKTSMARIFAKALNCEKGPTVKPCGKCNSCDQINRANSLDIIEIDGASNRGIDDIRTLRENVKLAPAGSRYKIYIIDEVHQITSDGFNALLKTLEEPPEHVKFIFATTHPQKLLPTILSRCQKIPFHLVPLDLVVKKLKLIASAEKLTIDEGLFYSIARAGGGSIRDAESFLDQLAPVILEGGQLKDIFSFLGIIDEETLNVFLTNLVKKDLSWCVDFIDDLVRDGKDLGVFLNALLEHLRNLLLAKVSKKSIEVLTAISPHTKQCIGQLTGYVTATEVLKLIDLLIEAKELSKKLNTVRVPLELAIVKFAHQETEAEPALKPESQKGKVKAVSKGKPKKIKTDPDDYFDLDDDDFDFVDDMPTQSRQKMDMPSEISEDKTDSAADDNLLFGEVVKKWKDILTYMHKTRAAMSTHLSYGQPVASSGKICKVGFSKKDSFHKEIVGSVKNLKFIEEVVSKVLNKSVGINFVLLDDMPSGVKETIKHNYASESSAGPEEVPEESNKPETASVQEADSFINELLDTFGGKIDTEN